MLNKYANYTTVYNQVLIVANMEKIQFGFPLDFKCQIRC